MPDLTDADRAAIKAAIDKCVSKRLAGSREMDEAIYRAGLAAGIERAAKVCEDITYSVDISEWSEMSKKQHSAFSCHQCAAAIRALK